MSRLQEVEVLGGTSLEHIGFMFARGPRFLITLVGGHLNDLPIRLELLDELIAELESCD